MSPHSLRHRLSGLAVAVLLVAAPALADWSADATTKALPQPGQKAPPEMKGRVYGRKGMLRMDSQVPAPQGGKSPDLSMSVLFDFEKRTGTTLMHAQKLASVRNLDELPVKLPGSCMGKTQDYDACLVEQGYKKTGTEKVNGHPTNVYEGSVPGMDGKVTHQKVWRPTDLPEVPYVRAQSLTDRGQMEINLTNIQEGKQPDALFTVPADYRKVDGAAAAPPMGGLKPEDFQGKTPEQIQELIRQRMSQGAPQQQGGGQKP
ncbi:hypothetical protein JY651_46130 [Pyxidicoccus parkwayensis]|uniref:DUF4412 domain-containing protein n=1 Tax=Pyxidicoccus parkwayensis TaxID=2813578 RepID=A0ABX7NY97_9BACT|nr:hypothetical protein [Pyxidicoccus parkwaysis]QSQ22420.1 hypothetical protein JY651_46130 [Pyxidicoccus parkwaysis]